MSVAARRIVRTWYETQERTADMSEGMRLRPGEDAPDRGRDSSVFGPEYNPPKPYDGTLFAWQARPYLVPDRVADVVAKAGVRTPDAVMELLCGECGSDAGPVRTFVFGTGQPALSTTCMDQIQRLHWQQFH